MKSLIFLTLFFFTSLSLASPKAVVFFVHGFSASAHDHRVENSYITSQAVDSGYDIVLVETPRFAGTLEHADNILAHAHDYAQKNGYDIPMFFIGHSQGGLNVRVFVHLHNKLFNIKNVTTMGTPHRGAPTKHMEIISNFLLKFGNALPEKARLFLEEFHQALLDFNISDFNERYADVPGIDYLSIATHSGYLSSINPMIAPMNAFLKFKSQSNNDGLISFESAAWNKVMYADGSVIEHNEGDQPKGKLFKADHLSQVFNFPHRKSILPYYPAKEISKVLIPYFDELLDLKTGQSCQKSLK